MFSFKLMSDGMIRVFYYRRFVGDCKNWLEVEELQKRIEG